MILINDKTQQSSYLEYFAQNIPINKKILAKREALLLKLPLFTIIYQKKDEENFREIAQNIYIKSYVFGENVYSVPDQLQFCYVIKGVLMLFVSQPFPQPDHIPRFYRRLYKNDYFGEKVLYSANQKLNCVKSVSSSLVLHMKAEVFIKTFSGHFKYPQLAEKTQFLRGVWALKQLKNRDIEKILLLSKVHIYKRKQQLFRENDKPQAIYVIIQGQLALYKNDGHLKKPFCILSAKQICGLQQMKKNQPYNYGAVCISQQTKIMTITRQLAEQLICKKVNQDLIQQKYALKQMISQRRTSKARIEKTTEKKKSVNIEACQKLWFTKRNKIMQTQNSMKKTIRTKTQHGSFLINDNDTHKMTLRKSSRKLVGPSQLSKAKANFREGKLSELNSSFTNDKQLLLKYLVRKQVKNKRAFQKERVFQTIMARSYLVKELYVEKSSAVKNHKRKLRNSRRHALSTPSLTTNENCI